MCRSSVIPCVRGVQKLTGYSIVQNCSIPETDYCTTIATKGSKNGANLEAKCFFQRWAFSSFYDMVYRFRNYIEKQRFLTGSKGVQRSTVRWSFKQEIFSVRLALSIAIRYLTPNGWWFYRTSGSFSGTVVGSRPWVFDIGQQNRVVEAGSWILRHAKSLHLLSTVLGMRWCNARKHMHACMV